MALKGIKKDLNAKEEAGARMAEEVPRVLRRDGVLVTAALIWVRGSRAAQSDQVQLPAAVSGQATADFGRASSTLRTASSTGSASVRAIQFGVTSTKRTT